MTFKTPYGHYQVKPDVIRKSCFVVEEYETGFTHSVFQYVKNTRLEAIALALRLQREDYKQIDQ